MATPVEVAKTETVVDIHIDTGRNDRDVEKGDNTLEDKRVKGTELVGHHQQADQAIDMKVSEEKEQEQQPRKNKETKTRIQRKMGTFTDHQAGLDLSPTQGQAIKGNDTEQTGRTDIQYVAQVSKNCTYIPETGIVMYSNEGDELGWAYLVSGREMDMNNNKRFAIEVVNTGHSSIIALGLVPAKYNTDAPPGWFENSVAYHADNGGIYVKSQFSVTRITTAKRGDKIALEISSDKDNTILQFQVKDSVIKLVLSKTVLYPCLGMYSRGDAVKLLDETIVNNGGDAKIPTMSSMERDGILISPNGTLSLWKWKGALYGLMSISNVNPAQQPIAFEVYGRDKAKVVHREILAPKKAWAECLAIKRGNVKKGITVEWTAHCLGAKEEKWTLETICPNEEQRQKYTLNVVIEPLEEQNDDDDDSNDDDDDDNSTSKKLMGNTDNIMRDELLERVRYSVNDAEVEELIDRQSGSTELTRLRKNIRRNEYSIDGLLQILENAITCNPRDENTMIDHVEKMLEYMSALEILQTRDNDENGFTVLHFAAILGSTRLIDLLLKKNKRIKYLAYVKSRKPLRGSLDGKLPLELAVDGKHDATAKALLDMMTPKSIVNLFWNTDHIWISLSIKELLKMELTETTKVVLDKFYCEGKWLVAPLELDNRNVYPRLTSQDFDSYVVSRGYQKDDTTAFQMIARSDLKSETIQTFSNHPCVKALTQHKWNRYARKMFWIQLVLYLFSWFALTFAAVTGVMAEEGTKYDKSVDYIRAVCECWACIISFLYLLAEFGQWKKQRRHYCYDGLNWFDLLSNLLILIVIPLRWTYNNAQWGVFGVGYICWTLRVIKFITMSRILGQLGFIIQGLVADVLKFGVYFLFILLSFSGGLFLALKGDDSLNVHNETSTILGILFVGVRVLVEGQPIGDLEYTGAKGYRTLSCIVMLLFLAITCAVMLNIFIAQLSSRYTKENDKVDEKFETHRARTIARYDLGEDLTSYLFIYRRDPMWVEHFKFEIDVRRSDDSSHGRYDDDYHCPLMMQPCVKMCWKFFYCVHCVLCLPFYLIYSLRFRGDNERVCHVVVEGGDQWDFL